MAAHDLQKATYNYNTMRNLRFKNAFTCISITNVLRTVYEYYDSIIDITKILIKLHHIENFIKSKATSSIKNLKHKKILLKINRKMLPIIEKSNLISTFKIRRNNF